LKISSLGLKNFRCYYGPQGPIDLTTTEDSNVVLFFGENMRGKTSLLQAVRWGLYGTARDRQGREIPVIDPATKEQLLSRDAESESDYVMEVAIAFEHDGAEYTLKRLATAKVLTPQSESDFAIHKELKSGTRVFPESAVDAYVQNMLSEDVARFFLFDAEMLEDYEDLLKDPEQEAAAVKQAIEKILGVPALKAFVPLGEEADSADRRQNAHLKKREKYGTLLVEVEQLKNLILSLRSDIKELESQRDAQQRDADEAELECKRNADLESRIKLKAQLEADIEKEESHLAAAREALAGLIRDAWWMPLAAPIQERLLKLKDESAGAMTSLGELHRLRQLEDSVRLKVCDLCASPLHQGEVSKMQSEASRLKLATFGKDLSALLDASKRAELYQQFSAQEQLAEFRVREENAAEAMVAMSELETRIGEVKATMENRSYGDYNAKYDRWQRLCEQVRKLEAGITERRELLREKESEHAKKQEALNKVPDADPRLALEKGLYRELSDLFEHAIVAFRDSLRESVGDDASRMFKELTTEDAYQGLAIDENYGCVLLDSHGSPVPGRSAGAEQIIALSLIGGLNAAAVREGPVVMDSNFARLDRGHRENVLRFLPHLGGQVVILVHSGEIDRELDLSQFGVSVARRYEIHRVSEMRSEIRADRVVGVTR